MNWVMKRARPALSALIAALCALGVGALQPVHASEAPPAWLNCPDEAQFDPRPNPEREPGRVREIAPSAGARSSNELFAHARFARHAYELYSAFDAGLDPRMAFAAPGLRLAGLIYGDPGRDTERGPRPPGRTRTLYGFVADEPASGRRYIVFRGTQQPAEWVRNAQAGQRPYPSNAARRNASAHVHAGFLEIFESLELDIDGRPTALSPALAGLTSGRDTIFVGHSLGSALATLAGVETSRRAPQNAARLRIVTLASPRVGDAGFAAMARAVGRIDRVCNLVDIVTAVPPSTPRTDYVHVGTPFRVSSYDWPALTNNLEKGGDQILCWHGDQSYAYMLSPSTAAREPAQCFLPSGAP